MLDISKVLQQEKSIKQSIKQLEEIFPDIIERSGDACNFGLDWIHMAYGNYDVIDSVRAWLSLQDDQAMKCRISELESFNASSQRAARREIRIV